MPYLLTLAVLAQAVSASQAQPPPTFRASTHLIVTTVSVKDRTGKPLEGLTASDFIVTENGQPQQIAFVEYQALGAEAPPDVAPSPVTAAVPAAAAPPGARPGDVRYRGRRLLVLYFDLYNASFFDELRMYAAADSFIATRLTRADLVAIMAFQNGRLTPKLDFSDDREALRSVLQRMQSDAGERESDSGATAAVAGAFGEDEEAFNLFSTDRQLAALQTAVTGLGPLPEVKTLVYLGGGLRLNGADNQAQLRATVNAAVRANVTINPVDTRGLVAVAPLGDASQPSPGGAGMFSGAIAQAALVRQQQAQDTYYALAKDTGGLATFDSNDLVRGITQAAEAVTSYYMIGYYSSNPSADGRFRRVKVSLAGGRAAALAYRSGYYGAKVFAKLNAAERERQLEDALRLDDPITEIPMAMEVNYFQLNENEYFVPVSVRMPGAELMLPGSGGSGRSEIDVIAEIKDTYGVTVRNVKDRLRFSVDRASAAGIARRPIQYETGFTLLPGDYVVKVLARNSVTGRIGTFQTPFSVPNLERESARLPTSTVVLATQRVPRGLALANVKETIASDVGNPLVSDGQKLMPAVGRTFRASQPMHVFLQAYEHRARDMRPLVAFVAFYRDGAMALETQPAGIASGWDGASKAVPIHMTVTLDTLAPGRYDCQVTVLDPLASRAAFWRATVLVVR